MKIVNIKSSDYTAQIDLSYGANCVSLRNTKYRVNVLREAGEDTKIENPFLYGMPILFPVNRISGGEFTFNERRYQFPINEPDTGCHIHGFLYETEFESVESGENFIKCRYDSDDKYSFFPHSFRIEIDYSLSDQGLLQKTRVYNLSNTPMPCLLGFHTTFNIAFAQGSSKEDVCVLAQVGEEIERNMENYLPTGRILHNTDLSQRFNNGTFKPFGEKISKHYKSVGDGRIELYNSALHIKAVYDVDEKFSWRLFYNGDANEYICLEPQNVCVDALNAGLGGIYSQIESIPPKDCREYFTRISVSEY